MERLLQRIRRVRPDFRENENLFLLRCSAPPHTALITQRFRLRKGVTEISHDIFLLRSVKMKVKGKRFHILQNTEKNVTRHFKDSFSDYKRGMTSVPWGLFWMIFILNCFSEVSFCLVTFQMCHVGILVQKWVLRGYQDARINSNCLLTHASHSLFYCAMPELLHPLNADQTCIPFSADM
jgi:hypothetical protein